MLSERSSRLEALAAHLPFPLDDFDAAAATFVRWRAHGNEDDRQTAQLWAYCFVVWYFYGRFATERATSASDLDWVIERSFKRIERSFDGIRTPRRFPQFVSVVCRNVLLSYRARRHETVEVEETTTPTPARGADGFDRILTRRLIERAIAALPDFAVEITRLRLLEGASYQEIAAATGLDIATARTYFSKAVARLRADPDLRALHENSAPPSALSGTPGNGAKKADPQKENDLRG
ncbi:RNA polymerase sigma factor [Rubrivirga sp. IMCC45206]|uniref:RNA polymerase sigma factor n=1 Tax=Rubrivirga sp. IMCC45206 TaxID=3391614 RepID=UPI0039901738